jgi:hydrogenase nickel incorporation protein HypA/HybF
MHELGIAEAVLTAVRAEGARFPDARPIRVGLKIGELAGIDEDALRFCFEAIVKGTDLESLRLEVEHCPRRHKCLQCGHEFVVREYEYQCPQCAGDRSECISGAELDLAFVEVEEHATSGVGAESPE